jgi:protein-S-isoprenylcysteine O-methyltransferase Ste14
VTDTTTGRGGRWVIAQFALMALIGVAAFLPPAWPESVRHVRSGVGLVLSLAGVGLALLATRAMGRSLTVFPTPVEDGKLVDTGPFRVVRHPIYSGGILVFGGIGLATSMLALAGTVLLAALWVGKIRVEEKQLRPRYAAYEEYARRVRFKLVPGIY